MTPKVVYEKPQQYVYLLQSRKTNWYKIGFSSDPARRAAELNKEIEDLDWHLVAMIPSKNPRRVERAFHAVFASRRITRGKEWFVFGADEVELFQALASEGNQEASLPGWWPRVLQHLRDRRQAPAATVFEEASTAFFEGSVLRVLFPVSLSIYVKLARDTRHANTLRDAVEAVYGKRQTGIQFGV